MDYYSSLIESMIAGNGVKNNIKHPIADNPNSVISSIDKSPGNGNEKEHIVTATYLLANSYKTKLWLVRARNLKSYSKQAKAQNDTKTRSEKSGEKVNKLDCVTETFSESTSKEIKIAVALFLSSNLIDTIRRDLICTILNDENPKTNIEYIVDLFIQPRNAVTKVREYIKSVGNCRLDKATEMNIISALIELSELLKDKSYCKLAMEINSSRYIKLASWYLKENKIHSIVPFEAAINNYLKTSVAQCAHTSERNMVYNQFKTNPIEAITVVSDNLQHHKKPAQRMYEKSKSLKSQVFSPNEPIQYHQGPTGYTRDIVATYHHLGPETYKILTYSDCLYDVIGRTTELVSSSGQKTRTDEIFDKLSWSERLQLLPDFRAKIVVKTTNGSDINSKLSDPVGDSSDITVCWFENGRSCLKTINLKKPKGRKIKIESA